MKSKTKIFLLLAIVGMCWYNWDTIDNWLEQREISDWQSEGDLRTSSRIKRHAWKTWLKLKKSIVSKQAETATIDRDRLLMDASLAEAVLKYDNEVAKDEYDKIKDQEFSVRQSAKILRVKVATINQAIDDGKLKASYKKRTYRVNRIDLARFWNNIVVGGEADKYPEDISTSILQQ